MSAAILNFFRPRPAPSDWTDQELAEFFRVADALTQSGFSVTTERGVTDEGDPWFVFVREASDDVIAHFARIEGEFLADASVLDVPVRGPDLRDVLDQVIRRYTVFVPQRRGENLFLHPAALLTAFVATALLEIEGSDAKAALGPDPVDKASRTAESDGKSEDAAKGAAARGLVVAAGGATPANAAGRAVSFNEAGSIGDHTLQNSMIITAVLAALGSLHSFEAAAASAGLDAADSDSDAERADRAWQDGHLTLAVRGDGASFFGEDAGRDPRRALEIGASVSLDEAGEQSESAGTDGARSFETEEAGGVVLSDLGDRPSQVAGGDGGPNDAGVPSSDAAAKLQPISAHVAETAPEPAGVADEEEALVGFQGVAVQLEALRALFAADAQTFLRELNDDERDPEEAQSPDGAGEPPLGNDDEFRLPDGAPAPSVVDFVFEGSDSQNEVLRHVVEFVLHGQSMATDLTIGPDSPARAAAEMFAENDGAAPDFVLFSSDSIGMQVFDFMPGVVFVDESLIYQGPIRFENDAAEIELSGGGSVLLIGVADIDLA